MFKSTQKCGFTLAEGATHVDTSNDNRKFAFTLAEVLVTLGIIGVVSAMTIPALTQNWQKRAYVTQLHKVYNIFEQAFTEEFNSKQAIDLAEAGAGISGTDASERNFLHKHFKVVKDCGGSGDGCFPGQYKSINGSAGNGGAGGYKVVIAGGTAVGLDFWHYDMSSSHDAITIGRVTIDINGTKGPNIGGRDVFGMYIYPDGTLDERGITLQCRKSGVGCPSGSNAKQARDNLFNSECRSSEFGVGCFGKILNDNWEMNY